ncbi:hypothetical protein AALO_G00258490 [Alosa alosa]|uniref:Uncharacterized protein n=1 Tax=Alosa alosa TaxID=278164 RepID=A0AAV6FTK8_9TELE|nr:hypothetical protein AALO_G00301520 [Alosa alosa]KAG5264831.1 hypothetical protein AALO_G00258490 [Alosa alosa]
MFHHLLFLLSGLFALSLSIPVPKGFASHSDNIEFYDDLENSRFLLGSELGPNIAPRVELPPEDTPWTEDPGFIPLPIKENFLKH